MNTTTTEPWGKMKVVHTNQSGNSEWFFVNIILKNVSQQILTGSITGSIQGNDNLAVYTPNINTGVIMYFVKGDRGWLSGSMYQWVSNDIQAPTVDIPKAAGGGSGYVSPDLISASTTTHLTNTYYKDNAGVGGSSGQQGEGGLLVLRKLLETQ
jgi:hypothetical protein